MPHASPHAPACAHACTRRLIYTLRQYPATEDFVYLVRTPAGAPGELNPYALQVVPFAALRADPAASADYYTLSVRGMTRYVDGTNAEFTSEWHPLGWQGLRCGRMGCGRETESGATHWRSPLTSSQRIIARLPQLPLTRLSTCPSHRTALDQWEREVQLYMGLRQLPVFRQHRLAKALANWRRAVRGAKTAKARAALAGAASTAEGGAGAGGAGGRLALSPAFQPPLRRVGALCCDVGEMRLHALKAGQVRGPRGWVGLLKLVPLCAPCECMDQH